MGTTYHGKPCKKGHNGIRYTCNGYCVECNKEKSKLSRKRLAQKHTRYIGSVCAKHPEIGGERLSSNGTCVKCHAVRSILRQKNNGYPVMKRQVIKLTDLVFNHYGNECSACGISDHDVLTIDHIAQDGNKHVSPAGSRYRGVHLYRWLVNNNFPNGFRTLCYNCNIKAYKEHKRKASK